MFGVGSKGYRPRLPPETPDDVATLVRACWAQEPENRPTMARILSYLRDCAAKATDLDSPIIPPDHTRVLATASWDSSDLTDELIGAEEEHKAPAEDDELGEAQKYYQTSDAMEDSSSSDEVDNRATAAAC
mmetsp:Transcript_2467/g.7361  ORF Transcript_2467/g.7361 Transcript_2467/m.7361 type:complete len:131 (+) Transcript_2467:1603-1995(+)